MLLADLERALLACDNEGNAVKGQPNAYTSVDLLVVCAV